MYSPDYDGIDFQTLICPKPIARPWRARTVYYLLMLKLQREIDSGRVLAYANESDLPREVICLKTTHQTLQNGITAVF